MRKRQVCAVVYKWLEKNTEKLTGRTVAVSGATGGIGVWLCRYLLMLDARIILLARDREKACRLREELLVSFPGASIGMLPVDLEDIASVKAAAEALQRSTLDGLILNAGAYHIPRHRCAPGYDNIFQINFAAPYYLARKLEPHLRKSRGQLVIVGSIAHNYSRTDPGDADFSTRKKHSLAYGNAKRYLMFSLYGLYSGRPGLAVTHPGITFTNITNHYPKLLFRLIKHPMKLIFMPPRIAALSILRGLFDSCGPMEWIGPRVFDIWGLPGKRRLTTCGEEELRQICRTADTVYKAMEAWKEEEAQHGAAD